MFRFLKQLLVVLRHDDFTLMHHGNAICDSRYRQQVVRNIKNAHSELGAERRKQLQNFRLKNQIESAGSAHRQSAAQDDAKQPSQSARAAPDLQR